MKSSFSVLAVALSAFLAALGVFARPGLSQQYSPPPAGYGPAYPGAEPTSNMAASPYAQSPYGQATYGGPYGQSFGVTPAGYRQPGDSVMAPPNGYPAGPQNGPVYGAPMGQPMNGQPYYEGPMPDGGPHNGGPHDHLVDEGHVHGDGFIDGGCETCGGDCEGGCIRNPRAWGGVMAFLNVRNERNLPPLVTTSPTGTPFAQAGLLPDATILVGGEPGVGGDEIRFGAKAFGGIWLDELHEVAIGADVWAVESDPETFFFASDGSPGSLIIAQPFESTLTNAPSRAIVAFPGFSSGSVRVTGDQYNTFGGDWYIQTNWNRDEISSIDLLAGYVFSRMDDILTINADRTSIPPNGPPPFGSTLNFNEFFRTQNEFHGGELGITSQLMSGRFTLNLTGKCGFGGMTQRLRIRGTTVTTVAGQPAVVTAGGLFTQPSNIGDYERTQFCVAPEVEARMSCWFTRHFGVTAGYQFYYWSNVAHAGDQIDTTINPTQFGGGVLVGPARPRAIFQGSDFWLQGLTFGVVGQF